MKRGLTLLAGGLTIVAILATAGFGGALIVDAFATLQRDAELEVRSEQLEQQVRDDVNAAEPLHATQDERTQAELVYAGRSNQLAWGLLASAAVLVFSVRWFVALRRPQPQPPRQVVQLHINNQPVELDDSAGATGASGVALPVLDSVNLSPVERIVAEHGRGPEQVIPILQALQTEYRYLPPAALARVCELTEITPAQIAGVASFYTHFRNTPVGEHLVTVCHGTACHVAGAERLTAELRRRLGIAPGRDTDPAGRFTIEPVACLGCCTLAPVMQVDGHTLGHVQAAAAKARLDEALIAGNGDPTPMQYDNAAHPMAATAGEIRLGMGSCCVANGSGRVHDALEAALVASGVTAAVKRVGCVGMCHQTPFIEVARPNGDAVLYSQVQPEHAREIVQRHFAPNGIGRRVRQSLGRVFGALRTNGVQHVVKRRIIERRDPPVAAFLGPQKHIATEHCGDLDPLDLDEYFAHDGFVALQRARALSPDEIIAAIDRSGLRGRGGAGFPTGVKWRRVREASGKRKYIICNGDEGDPGAFMDRMLMESYPYRIIEGLAIAAHATGAAEGVFYIRAEYPLAVERIRGAIAACEERELLGGLRLRVVQGAGAFVCGEETALIASLEGQRGMPSLRPPYPADKGLHGCPTLVNNVETFAMVPWILRHGPEAYAALGTERSKGTKVFALAGKVRRGGLIEVPMGVTIRQIVEDIGGGVKEEATAAGVRPRAFKAVQIGGPSGGCVPAALADTPVDFEALAELGAIMGSGGLVVLDETSCMVDIARYFLSFTQNQSCGKCAPCRIGTRRMLEILERLCAGEGTPDDLDNLERLAHSVAQSSLCGLGKTAPNPVLTTLRYFRDEYEAHLEGRCPAGRCKELVRYEVTDACSGCTLCAQHCPAGAIALTPYERHEIDTSKCTRCDGCRVRCPEGAIAVVSG